MSDPTGFVEMAEQLAAQEAEIERLNSRMEDMIDADAGCERPDDHADLRDVRAELAEANAKLAAIDEAGPPLPSPLPAAVRELLAALDDRMEAKKFGHGHAAHQYRVEQAFRVVRELVEAESPPATTGTAGASMVDGAVVGAPPAKPNTRRKRATEASQ